MPLLPLAGSLPVTGRAGKSSTFLIFPEISNLYLASTAAGSCITSVSAASASASSFCQHANISDMLHSILTKLGHNNKCMNVHLWHDQIGVKGHVGVTRGQKGHFHQKCYFSYRLHGMVLWLMHIHQLNTPLQKLSAQILIWGYFRSQGSKGHFHQKYYFYR